ncbi:MAG: L-2-amino-thiazoline-4-carboxylic acid hydrolase [Butyrivibrio sp.]|nr:L-2-amino-thiazoline-4-carboxylic acid hydrolase [Butyrivibrio sp.]
MSNTLKKSFIFKRFYSELVEKYGTAKAGEIWKYAEDELSGLKNAEPTADKASVSNVFPAVALYRSVEHFYPGEALPVTRAYGTKMGLRMQGIFRIITALPGIPSLIWKNMDNRIVSKLTEGYEIKNLEVDKEHCFLDVVRCPLYDKALELGTPEAVQMICCMDKEYMNGFRGIDYKRIKSVAEGDDCCDYRLLNSLKK